MVSGCSRSSWRGEETNVFFIIVREFWVVVGCFVDVVTYA